MADDTQSVREHFAHRMKALRYDNGWSQVELAARAGLSYSSVQNYEAGKTLPQTDNMLALARTLGVPLSELLP